jgi:hypothetical protein
MPYAADGLGRPVLFISSMAMHTQNLHQDARASLLITQPDSSGDPLGAARVTLLGTTAEVPAAEVRDLYLSRYGDSKYWQEYTDFAYHRLEVASVYFIGGFGVMGWVPAEEYTNAHPLRMPCSRGATCRRRHGSFGAGTRPRDTARRTGALCVSRREFSQPLGQLPRGRCCWLP